MTRLKPHNEIPFLATKPLEHIHSDIRSPINPTSREGFKYIMNFVEDYSSMLFIYFLQFKNEVPTALKNIYCKCST